MSSEDGYLEGNPNRIKREQRQACLNYAERGEIPVRIWKSCDNVTNAYGKGLRGKNQV